MEKRVIELVLDEDELNPVGVYTISLVKNPAHEGMFVWMNEDKPKVFKFSEEKHIVCGPAIIPNKKIRQYDSETGEEYYIFYSKETVEKLAYNFLKNHNNSAFNFEHSDYVENVTLVEQWIIEDPKMDKSSKMGMDYPSGTWMMSVKIDNCPLWDKIKQGSVKGFSIEAWLVAKIKQSDKYKDILDELQKIIDRYEN